MPWKATTPMDDRVAFIAAVQAGETSMAALCRRFGISRKTGYKWWQRYQADGVSGLAERSRAPRTSPQAISAEVTERVLATRAAPPSWGPRKLLAWLARQEPALALPAASTVGELLRREGLTVPRRRRPHATPSALPLRAMDASNAVWTLDFKGPFLTGDGHWCYPLTLIDGFSRYLLRCQALTQPTTAAVQPILAAAFQEFGLPRVIRSDNGPPFASIGLGGLSRLAVWWITLGILPERIAPGQPAQNGRHERFHRTLKAETAQPPAATIRAQQQVFVQFRQLYNTERPHEALGQCTPAQVYQSQPRADPVRPMRLDYPTADAVRQVRHNGELYWRKHYIYLSAALAGQPVGLTALADGAWEVVFGPLVLGVLDERQGILQATKRTGRGRSAATPAMA